MLHAAACHDQRGRKISKSDLDRLDQSIPNIFWLTELTIPSLYTANKRKLGEFFMEASASKQDVNNWRALAFGWLPGLHVRMVSISRQDYGFTFGDWSINGHVPLLRTKDGEDQRLEW